MIYDIASMGNRIRTARQLKNLKQLAVCEKLNMSQANYSNIENGNQEISVSQLIEIANILDVSASWLLGEESISDLTDSERFEIEKYKNYLINKRGK